MRSLVLSLSLLLGACATAPVPQAVVRPAQVEQAAFVLNGRISVKYDGKRSPASIYWTHGAAGDEILLLAPLGQTVARIQCDAQGMATLETAQKQYEAGNAEELMQKALGWSLPLDGLSHWALALPDPKSKAGIELDADGHVGVMHQDGWEISYLRYAVPAADSLPLRFTLAHDELEIQVLIDKWEFQPKH
ncbi:MAG: outer membrane lipoprotein LolB [Nitrosomonadales bacterium]|nr:outer membrane lipoprotein LolB [Nitrosomonadales bacterium]